MKQSRRLYLACYDVAHAKRLKRALQLVRAFATGGQKSVHEVWLSSAEREQLLVKMQSLLKTPDDRFLLVRLDPRQRVHTLGVAVPPHTSGDWFYLG